MSTRKANPETPELEPQAIQKKPSDMAVIAALAYPGTEDQLGKVWSRMTELPFKIVPYADGESLQTILAELVADVDIADDFVLVPANVLPCKPVDLDELSVPYVYTTAYGERKYDSRVPMKFSKASLVEHLAGAGGMDDEAFLHTYFDTYRHYPVEVGFSYGNFITPVLRGNPCESVVMEALVRKRFISASPEGYKAISSLIENTLLSQNE